MRLRRYENVAARLDAGTRRKHARIEYLDTVDAGSGPLHRFRLGNGLRVSIQTDRSAPVVAYQTWFHVGSRHEAPGKTGLAHLLEHLMFHETRGLPPGEFDRRMEASGGDANAATWTDWTAYQDAVPRRHLAMVVRLEADRMARLVLRDRQVRTEKEVVVNERRYRVDDDVEGFANEKLWATAFRHHPYRWPTIGWLKDIEGLGVDDCVAFYRSHYAPNRADVVIVGDVTVPRALGLVQRHYGGIPPGPPVDEVAPVEPPQRRERRVTLRGATPTEKLAVGWRAPAFDDPDHAALTVANEILVGGRSSRLHRALVSDGELASEVRGTLSPFAHPGLHELWVAARPGRGALESLAVVDEAIAALAAAPAPEADLEKARNRLELGLLTAMETAAGRAEHIGFHQTVLGDAARALERTELLRRVSAEAVRRAAARWLVPSGRTLVHVLPSGPSAALQPPGGGRRARPS